MNVFTHRSAGPGLFAGLSRALSAVVASLVGASLLLACSGPTPNDDNPTGKNIPSTASSSSTGTAGEGSDLAEARALLFGGDFDGAVEVLEPLTEEHPEAGRAWLLLGLAHHRAERWEAAMAAHREAAKDASIAPRAYYQAAATSVRSGNEEEAWQWLERLHATGRQDMTALPFDPDFQAVRDDPRLRSLYPSQAELSDPFVEEVRVLHEWRGEAEGDSFGWIARDVGDVDGDGVHDVTTSAPTRGADEAGAGAGKVYLYSGASGELLWSVDGAPGAQLGIGIEAAGDVNGDGVPDVVAGAPGIDRAYAYSGRDGQVVLTLEASQTQENFGRKVSDVGDLDGDGRADVLVGAPANDARGQDAGRAALYSGKDGSILVELWGEEAGDAFGSSGAGACGPRVGGGCLIVVGAPNAGPGDRGRTYVYRLEGPAATAEALEPAFVIDAEESGARLGGMFVSVVGDVDGDGRLDVYASDWADGGAAPGAGRIYVHSGATGERLLTLAGETFGEGFGIGPADAGDVDGDGHDDLVVGAWQHGGAAPSGGRVSVHSGRDGRLLRTITCRAPGDTFGFDATGLKDVDGDGRIDFLLTSAWSPWKGPRTGRMFVIAGEG